MSKLDQAMTAYAASPTEANRAAIVEAVAPKGWKLVPVEPTEEMERAAVADAPIIIKEHYARDGAFTGKASSLSSAMFGDCYRAMLAVSPTPPAAAPAPIQSAELAYDEWSGEHDATVWRSSEEVFEAGYRAALAAPAATAQASSTPTAGQVFCATHDLGAAVAQHVKNISQQEQAKPTDISQRLRKIAEIFTIGHEYHRDTLAAADEIDRYYGGMLAWKQTAEKKDRKLTEEITRQVDERCKARAAAQEAKPTDLQALTDADICELASESGDGLGMLAPIKFARAIERHLSAATPEQKG